MNARKLILISMMLLSLSAYSSVNSDFQSWNNITVTGEISNNIRYSGEVQARIGEDVSTLSQSIIRSGIGYQIDKQNSIWLGYGWIYTTQPFSTQKTYEHRTWQQYLWVKNYQWIKAFSRTRVEERFINNHAKVAWRLRQFGRLQLPLKQNSNLFISSAEEIFIRLNNARNNRFDQNRLFLGLGTKPTKNWLFEVGYLNHIIFKNQSPDYHGNYIAMNLVGRLS